MPRTQLDFFRAEQQPDLLGDDYKPVVFRPDQNRVRAKLLKLLAEARAAKSYPWDAHHVSLYRLIFPQMTGCLPEGEAAQLRLEFETELSRLDAVA